jgi:hypothetical protein
MPRLNLLLHPVLTMRRFLLIAAILITPLVAWAGGGITTTGAGGGPGGGAPAYSGPGDVTTGWSFWVGLRALSGATAGTKSANICNSGDANCADVNTLANGNFDVATATGAPLRCGGTGGTCTIKTLYDKVSTNNLTQTTIANRPTLHLNCLNTSLPCADFASGAFMQSGNVSFSQTISTATAVMQPSNNSIRYMIAGDVGNDGAYAGPDAHVGCDAGFFSNQDVVLAFSTWAALICVYPASGTGNASTTLNGSTTTFNGSTADISGQPLTIGTELGNGSTAGFVGSVAETGFAATTVFSGGTITSLNSNIRNYWGF